MVVRPDGNISLPLLNDVRARASRRTSCASRSSKQASKFIEDPTATVVVKEIHSRQVFITGEVGKPGGYPIVGSMNVMQLIAIAGGVQEYAKSNEIVILRSAAGKSQKLLFNYKDVVKGKNVQQNIVLEPGDTVVVP